MYKEEIDAELGCACVESWFTLKVKVWRQEDGKINNFTLASSITIDIFLQPVLHICITKAAGSA